MSHRSPQKRKTDIPGWLDLKTGDEHFVRLSL